MRFIVNRFKRARRYRDCCFALAQASEATAQNQLPFWPGPDASCSGVLVLPTTRDLGDELRILRFIGDLKAHIAAAQERLAYWFGSDDQQLQGNFRPLKAAVTAGDKPKASASAGFPNRETRPCLPSKTGHQCSKTSANHFLRCNIWKNQHGSEHSAN